MSASAEADSIKFVLFSSSACIPRRATPEAAGFDLFASEDSIIAGESVSVIKTGVGVRFPAGCYGCITGRSSNYLRGYRVEQGTIDRDYEGGLGIMMSNQTTDPLYIFKGSVCAQLVCLRYSAPSFYTYRLAFADAPAAESPSIHCNSHLVGGVNLWKRGDSGFGSTGGAL